MLTETVIQWVLPTILTAVLGWLGVIFTRYTGVKIEEKHMNVLHQAILTGISSFIAKGGLRAENLSATDRRDAIAHAVQYTESGTAKDAIKALGVSTDRIAQIALSKIALLAAGPEASKYALPPNSR